MMKKKSLASIRSIGKCIPPKKIDNNHFVKLGLDTSDTWIKERTGIETRFFTTTETSSELGYQAAKNALKSGKFWFFAFFLGSKNRKKMENNWG